MESHLADDVYYLVAGEAFWQGTMVSILGLCILLARAGGFYIPAGINRFYFWK